MTHIRPLCRCHWDLLVGLGEVARPSCKLVLRVMLSYCTDLGQKAIRVGWPMGRRSAGRTVLPSCQHIINAADSWFGSGSVHLPYSMSWNQAWVNYWNIM